MAVITSHTVPTVSPDFDFWGNARATLHICLTILVWMGVFFSVVIATFLLLGAITGACIFASNRWDAFKTSLASPVEVAEEDAVIIERIKSKDSTYKP